MKKTITFIIILCIVIVAAIYRCTGSGDDSSSKDNSTSQEKQLPIDETLTHRTDSFLATVKPVGSIGILVYDMTANRDVYAHNDLVSMRPASCMKLLTCIAALDKYGVKYKYHTRLYTSGKMKGDTLIGDVILKTHFDPFFNRDSLNKMTRQLKKKGISIVKGHVILDMAFHDKMIHEIHWTIGDLKTRALGILYEGPKTMKNEMIWSLRAAGISVPNDSIRLGRMNPRKVKEVADISTPLHNAVLRAFKNSSNINAEAVLYLLGYSVKRDGNYRKNGIVALNRFIETRLKAPVIDKMPKEWKTCVLHDGNGLCPDDHVTPRLLVALLQFARLHKEVYNEVYEDFPLSGTDGTLHNRMYKQNVKGKVKAKTGTLTREGGISSLAGYFTGRDGHEIAFAIINNECPVMDGRWWQDRYMERAVFKEDRKRK